MEVECSSLDRISNLPQNIIPHILTFLPIRDALRTSIFSRHWRYKWTNIPKLFIDQDLIIREKKVTFLSEKIKLTNIIFHILLQHTGPIREFTWLNYLEMHFEVDQSLKRFLSKCPLLEELHLVKCPLLEKLHLIELQGNGSIVQEDKLTFFELFNLLPTIKKLSISKHFMKYFVTHDMPPKLPISLVNLKVLHLGVFFMEQDELLSILCMIKSSPNLTNFYIENQRRHDSRTTETETLVLQDCSDLKLDHLDDFKMQNFGNLAVEIDFLKLIVVNSPVLKKVRIEINENIASDHEELKYLMDSFSDAFPLVKFSIELFETPDIMTMQYIRNLISTTSKYN
ncbi:F-box/FBD/LRR-repeat protein At1g13570-like [Rutidosis leptorrhynchoides]|uniref:F-box/FBD/LRR-repeat protein At1g13570-like n=1 Tax=Rutidosis leptorrhynchoides TaxID=125765 RepID=UPI003A997E5C